MAALDDLLDSIFHGIKPTFYPEFEAWVRGSRRYRAFAASYHSKIRAKLKNARDESGVQDVRAELETAALLLHEGRFTLEYEKYASTKQRGPDFTVTYKTHTPFNVEVRRIRSIELDDEDPDARTGKLVAVLCDKVGQMPPGIVNLLWLTADREVSEADLTNATNTLLHMAERKDEAFFTRRRFASVADFLKQYHRLSGIVLRQSDGSAIWLNPLARHKMPPDIVTALGRLGA
ncbi:hypothetical protein [Aggregatilinea lenta]|uniref:hypothetical protein n=1 Tax=Aggregatilinea lenta TaxID=913108 RepID=UPI000E5C0094|nr:hypothetical protein [Aggregatilinea lenta]